MRLGSIRSGGRIVSATLHHHSHCLISSRLCLQLSGFPIFQHGIPLRALFFSSFFFVFLIQAPWSHGGDGNGTVLVFQSWSRFAAVAPVKSNQAFGGRTGRGNWRSRLKLRFDLVGMGSHELQPLERIRKFASDLSLLLPVGQDVTEKVYKYHDRFTEGAFKQEWELNCMRPRNFLLSAFLFVNFAFDSCAFVPPVSLFVFSYTTSLVMVIGLARNSLLWQCVMEAGDRNGDFAVEIIY